MTHHTKQDQLRELLRPLSEHFTSQVAAAVMAFVQDSVRAEVESVLGRALFGVDAASLAAGPAPQAIIVVETFEPEPAPAAPAPVTCSKRGCDGSWYRPSGRDNRLCYTHFLEAGGKAPPGKKTGTKAKQR